MLFGQGTTFVAADLYGNSSYGAEHGAPWRLLLGIEVGFVVFFATFVAVMNKDYRNTFFSTSTGKQFTCQNFLDAKSDRAKIEIFLDHEALYEDIKGVVKEWVHENWERWNEEKPDWFTERTKANVPRGMIP